MAASVVATSLLPLFDSKHSTPNLLFPGTELLLITVVKPKSMSHCAPPQTSLQHKSGDEMVRVL
jgi:hypothetical protein